MTCGKCGPVAVRSKFGWLLSGPVRSTNAASNEAVSNLILESPDVSKTFENDTQVVEDLRQFWNTEIVGISPESKEVERDSFMEIKFDWLQPRHEVNLPWKPKIRPHSTGYDMCLVRLHQLRVRLQKDKDLLHEYNNIFESQLQDGIIEKVPDVNKSDPCHFYLIMV